MDIPCRPLPVVDELENIGLVGLFICILGWYCVEVGERGWIGERTWDGI